MKVLTESILRREFKNKLPEEYIVKSNTLVTPSASQYLREKRVKLVTEKKQQKEDNEDIKINENLYKPPNISDKKIAPKYISYYSQGAFEEKPEHMTQIYGNKLVDKDDPRIVFRGKLDSLQSQVLKLQVLVDSKNISKLNQELEEVLNYIREILRAEVLNENFKRSDLIGLNEQKLREIPHKPKKFLGVDHILPNYKMGVIIIELNSLRSSVREVEIAAINAFKKGFQIRRLDIIKALNRLSSCIYIMMCKHKAGLYK